jgi:hypothetical protein
VFWALEIARELEIVVDDVCEESGVFKRRGAFSIEVGYGYDFANTDYGANPPMSMTSPGALGGAAG